MRLSWATSTIAVCIWFAGGCTAKTESLGSVSEAVTGSGSGGSGSGGSGSGGSGSGGSGSGGSGAKDPCANVTCPGTQVCDNGYCYSALPSGAKECEGSANASIGAECCSAADCCGETGGALACDPESYTCQNPTPTTTNITCNTNTYSCPVYWLNSNGGASVWIGGACTQAAAENLGGSGCPDNGGAYCVFDCQACCVATGASCQVPEGSGSSNNPCCEGQACIRGTCAACVPQGMLCNLSSDCCGELTCNIGVCS
jgi:hypothetical protein